MRSRILASGYLIVSVLFLLLAQQAESGMTRASVGNNDGAHVDLVVRKVMVTPVRAHVGDTITIEMTWEYWGDLVNDYYDTTFAEVLANGKVVARKPFVYSFGATLGEVYRETLLWDTKGMAPGKYRIRGEVPLQLDATPYDNFLDVKELLVLLPAGESFSAGEEGGNSAVAENRFWRNR